MVSIRTRVRSQARVLTAVCALALAGACEEEVQQSSGRGSGTPTSKPAAPAAGAGAAADAEGKFKALDTLVFKDEDFVESEKNRDPFRSYVATFRIKGPDAVGSAPDQRPVIMPTTAVESMKLIAVISGLPRPKAMLVDSMNVGYVVERGDYLGRPRVLQAAGNVQMVLNWRVDRIRENEIVVVLPNPGDPTHPPTTRIIGMSEQK